MTLVRASCGVFDGLLQLIGLRTGEVLYTQLQGSANDVNVRLDRSSIMHENTYIGLSSKRY